MCKDDKLSQLFVIMTNLVSKLIFLKEKHIDLIKKVGETLLGVPYDELSEEYILGFDSYVNGLEDFLQKDVKTLFWMTNSRFLSIFLVFRIKKFNSLNLKKRTKFLRKMSLSHIPLLRTSYVTWRALVSWAFYTTTDLTKEMDYPGTTIGREDETPTLLFGKHKWQEIKEGTQN